MNCSVTCDNGLKTFNFTMQNATKKSTIDLNETRITPKSWWHDGLSKSYRILLAARKKARLTNNIVDFEAAIHAKLNWENEAIAELNKNPNTKDSWRFINNLKGRSKHTNHWIRENDEVFLTKELERHVNCNNFLESWRKIKIIPIPKVNRDIKNINNFRPISLLSVIV